MNDAWAQVGRVLSFQAGHNTNMVLAGTVVLGIACGVIGSFLLLRRRSLMADALSHAALPGVCAGFLAATWLGEDGRSLWALLPAAALFGLLGVACVQALTTLPRVKEDAAIGVVLSVFFAVGVVLLSHIQVMDAGNRAGISRFIFGQAATMRAGDSLLIAALAGVVLIVALALFKELRALCFDAAFTRSLGWSTLALDGVMLVLLTTLTVAGLSAVGAILMVALLIIPPAAARFWTDRLSPMLVIAGSIGAAGSLAGTVASAVLADVPTGPAIVVACGLIFAVSLLASPRRGWLAALARQWSVARSIARQHLLRAVYEIGEMTGDLGGTAPITDLLARRSWSMARLQGTIRRCAAAGEVRREGDAVRLTDRGLAAAAKIVRGHRLWEHFLLTHAERAASHLDRRADDIEHVLGDELVRELERSLQASGALAPGGAAVPGSAHALARHEERR